MGTHIIKLFSLNLKGFYHLNHEVSTDIKIITAYGVF